jgi:CRISPR-associated protein Csm3
MILKDLCSISGDLELLSGTRIGGSDDSLQIGGTDLTVIRDPVAGSPYIPGSSLKGRMRSCLEQELGRTSGKGEAPCDCGRSDCAVCRLFGPHKNTRHQLGPTRIIVHDAALRTGSPLVIENKTESTNNRNSGTALHPRTVERVAPGAKFSFELGIKYFDLDEQFTYKDKDGREVRGKDALVEVAYHAMDLLEDFGIGAGTGKGYGRIRIVGDKREWGKLARRRTTANG